MGWVLDQNGNRILDENGDPILDEDGSSSSSSISSSSSSSSLSSSSSSFSLSSSSQSSSSSSTSSSSSSTSLSSSSSSNSSSSSISTSLSSSSTSSSSFSTILIICDFERELISNGIQCPCGFKYTSMESILGGSFNNLEYLWEVFDNLTDQKIAELDSTSNYFIYAWPYESEFKIKLTIFDSNGVFGCSTERVYFDEDCFTTITSGGGAPPYKIDNKSSKFNIKVSKVVLSKSNDKSSYQSINIKHVKLE